MQVNPLSAIPAAGLAVATLLPKSMSRRHLMGGVLVGAAYGAQLALDDRDFVLVGVVPTGEEHAPATQQVLNRISSAVTVGVLSIPVVATARLVPVRRVFAAAALAGGYVALDAKVAEVTEVAKKKALEARAQARRAKDRVSRVRESAGLSKDTWHQAATR